MNHLIILFHVHKMMEVQNVYSLCIVSVLDSTSWKYLYQHTSLKLLWVFYDSYCWFSPLDKSHHLIATTFSILPGNVLSSIITIIKQVCYFPLSCRWQSCQNYYHTVTQISFPLIFNIIFFTVSPHQEPSWRPLFY